MLPNDFGLVVRQALNAIFLVFVYIFLWLLQLPNRTLLKKCTILNNNTLFLQTSKTILNVHFLAIIQT